MTGIFRRGNELVHTPRIGEDGYVPPDNEQDDLGPAQVQPISVNQLKAMVEARYDVCVNYFDKKLGQVQNKWALAPREAINSAYENARMGEDAPNVRPLRGVTHTPTMRPNGTVLDTPGYDQETGLLYLPDAKLVMPPVPDRPTAKEIKAAAALLLEPVARYPFVSSDHRANWAGMMLTPLLQTMVPRPYMGGIVTAPTRGTGKTGLVQTIMNAHGGVLHGELPREGDEMKKVILATLVDTTAPVVIFDNLTGVVRSSVLEALMTAETWTDRILGASRNVTAPNDRLWLFTGNNAKIGGDLVRRVLYIKLDAKMPNPHRRQFDFSPPEWVKAHRVELLHAMLTIIRAWVVEGKPTTTSPEDNFANWRRAVGGILGVAGIPGTFGEDAADTEDGDPEDEDWSDFLEAVHVAYPGQRFSMSDLTASLRASRPGLALETEDVPKLDPRFLPGADLAENFTKLHLVGENGFNKSLGAWFSNRKDRFTGRFKAEFVTKDKHRGKLWQIVEYTP